MNADELAQKAMNALNGGDPRAATALLSQALEAAGQPRADLLHAQGVVLLQLGESAQAAKLMEEAIDLGWKGGAPPEFMVQAHLGLAAAHEDADQPAAALEVYEKTLEMEADNPRTLLGRANLLLALGRLDEALSDLEQVIADGRDSEDFIEGTQALVDAIRGFRGEDRNPYDLLVAHRESYCEFFDDIAAQQAEQGWISECARMYRKPDGSLGYSIPEGARPYAAVRVDVVDPSTGQAGQIGDQPMVVAVAGAEPLARAVVTFEVEGGLPYTLRVSSQAPWDQLPIQVRFAAPGGAEALDELMGAWYSSGFEGRFGSKDGGRFHYISDPTLSREGRGVTYDVDMGRANMLSLEDLLGRLRDLSFRHPIREVLLGRGHLAP
ncbi:MAG: tetratricopeptide repeat protein [Alphaproteobacteria bacterium]|nr:tetratricopeptide repeat protein [Alphaproteobacteria bacterium]MCB9794691.1 tetratricopeptide repeat protein [Alphaproteobacteria bacterium]